MKGERVACGNIYPDSYLWNTPVTPPPSSQNKNLAKFIYFQVNQRVRTSVRTREVSSTTKLYAGSPRQRIRRPDWSLTSDGAHLSGGVKPFRRLLVNKSQRSVAVSLCQPRASLKWSVEFAREVFVYRPGINERWRVWGVWWVMTHKEAEEKEERSKMSLAEERRKTARRRRAMALVLGSRCRRGQSDWNPDWNRFQE